MIGIKSVKAMSEYRLKLKFDNGKEKIFDMKLKNESTCKCSKKIES